MTIQGSDFSVATVQAVAFTRDRSALTPSKVIATITPMYADRFNGDMQVIPIPKEFPDEISRLELKSEDNRWSLNSSLVRMSSIWTATQSNDVPPVDVVIQCAQVLSHFFRQQGAAQVNRLALVLNRVATGKDLAPLLIARFCAREVCDDGSSRAPLRHSKAFQIHNLKKYQSPMAGVRLNSWVRCKTESEEEQKNKLFFEQDINTPHEESGRSFSPAQIDEFFLMAQGEADQILNLYFPEI